MATLCFRRRRRRGAGGRSDKTTLCQAACGQATGNVAATPADAPADEGVAEVKTEELTPEQRAKKIQNCTNAQKQIADMTADRNMRLQYTNEKGELAFITPELQQARLSEAQAMSKNTANDLRPADGPVKTF